MATEGENAAASSSNFEEEIKKLMGKGKVHLVCSEFLDAVKCFEEATKKLDEKYGEAADQCGEAYFYYGKSLLEVARSEGDRVLGTALQGAIESNEQENGDEAKTGEKSEEAKKENTDATAAQPEENKTDDEKAKAKEIFVGDVDEVDETEKEEIKEEVLDAMTEEALEEAMEEDASKTDDKTSEEETVTEEKQKDVDKMETISEEKEEKKDEKTSEEVTNEKAGDEKKPEEKGSKKEDATEKENATEKEDTAEKKETKQDDDNKEENKEKATEDDKDEDKEEDAEENDENEEDENMEAEGGDDEEGGDENAEEPEPEDEPSYMELAWQMLEMARIVYNKRDSKEGKLMLGQCHLKLGEIQMEQEQFLSAIEDFLKCLDIQKELLPPDDRLLAETAYNIGLAFSFQSMHDKSKDYYSQALETIRLRIKSLEESIKEAESKSKGKDKATPDNPLVANNKELKELQELYPEIKLKVDDAEEMIKQAKEKPNISSVMGNGSTTTIGFGDSNGTSKEQPATLIATKKKPVAATDISHLVHRNKRKPEEADGDDTIAKKPRQDPEVTEPNGKPAETTNNNAEAAAMET